MSKQEFLSVGMITPIRAATDLDHELYRTQERAARLSQKIAKRTQISKIEREAEREDSRDSVRQMQAQIRRSQRTSRRDSDSKGSASAAVMSKVGPTEPERFPAFCFVETDVFQLLVAFVLLCNLLSVCMETDDPFWPYWRHINCAFLLFYVLELAARLLHRGPSSEKSTWTVYDIFIVVLGIVDILVITASGAPSTEYQKQFLGWADDFEDSALARGTRWLMLTRLLRVKRICRMHTSLKGFVRMLGAMMPTFGWILFIISALCFMLAIVLTRLVGHGLLVTPTDENVAAQVRLTFKDIPTSLFTLFRLTTSDDWSLVAEPLVVDSAWWRVFFVAYITFMSWTMLSLLTAVASEYLIGESAGKKDDDALMEEIKRQKFTEFLCQEFIMADHNENGFLEFEEFEIFMNKPGTREEMQNQGVAVMDDRGWRGLWEMLDLDDDDKLSIEELITGMSTLQENFGAKHVANVGFSLKRFGLRIEECIGSISESLDEQKEQQDQLLKNQLEGHKKYKDQWCKFLAHARSAKLDSKKEPRSPSSPRPVPPGSSAQHGPEVVKGGGTDGGTEPAKSGGGFLAVPSFLKRGLSRSSSSIAS